MANTTQANVLAIAPELTNISPETWAMILADVAADVSSEVYGTKQEIAQRYLAAHYLTLAMPGSVRNAQGSGPVTSESVGQVSVSYGSVNYRDRNRYDETSYGRMFNQIRRSCVIPFVVITP